MTKKEILFLSIIVLLVLIIIIGLVPVIIGSIINQGRPRQIVAVANQTEPPKVKESDALKSKKAELLIMVSGKISIEEENNVSFVVLASDYGKKYILVGAKTEELKGLAGKEEEVTVVGVPKPPMVAEIKGEQIKRTIEVKNFQIKKQKETK